MYNVINEGTLFLVIKRVPKTGNHALGDVLLVTSDSSHIHDIIPTVSLTTRNVVLLYKREIGTHVIMLQGGQ